jgi:hypothetical protein
MAEFNGGGIDFSCRDTQMNADASDKSRRSVNLSRLGQQGDEAQSIAPLESA